MWNFPEVYHLKMVFEEYFLRLTTEYVFKKWVLEKREFSYFFKSANNVVVTKQIYFSPAFLKSWVHISDNIAGVVGVSQYY